MRWTKKKPKFKGECVLIIKHKTKSGWEYSIYQIKKIEFEDKWYMGWLTGDGVEYGDLADLQAQYYLTMPLDK